MSLVFDAISQAKNANAPEDKIYVRGSWTSGWGQGITEYLLQSEDSERVLNLSCPDDEQEPVKIFFSNKDGAEDLRSITISNHEFEVAWMLSDCRACLNNYELFWDSLRQSAEISVSTMRNERIVFKVTNGREVIPEKHCQHPQEL